MKTSVASLMTTMMMLMTVLVIHAHEAAAKEFKVGGKLGWQLPDGNNTTLLYNQWASRRRFHVGDTLSFEYNKNDSVLVVEKWDYYHCDTSSPIAAYDGGKSVVQLDRPGPFYFISGAPDHCRMGQRLLVDVMSPHPHDPRPYAAPPSTSPWPAPTSSSGGVVVSGVARTLLLLPLFIATFSTSLA